MWYSGATNRIIKGKHTNYYERKMLSNKVEYSTAERLYYRTHHVNLTVCMADLSSSKIIEHSFNVDNNKAVLSYLAAR